MNTREAILDHQPGLGKTHLGLAGTIDENSDDNKSNTEKFFRLAAEEGVLPIALDLLRYLYQNQYKHSTKLDPISYPKKIKSPLYLALKNKHDLLAQVLWTCGLSIDKAKAEASQKKDDLVLEKIVNLKFDMTVVRAVLLWDYLHDKSCVLGFFCSKFFSKMDSFYDEESKYPNDASGMMGIQSTPTLSDLVEMETTRISAITEADIANLIKEMKYDSIEDYHRILTTAFRNKNHIQLIVLLRAKFKNEVFPLFISHDQFELMRFWMIVSDNSPYTVVLQLSSNEMLLNKFLKHYPAEGILHCLISQSIKLQERPTLPMRNLFRLLNFSNLIVGNKIIEGMQTRYKTPVVTFSINKETPSVLCLTTRLGLKEKKLLGIMLNRFNMSFQGQSRYDFPSLLPKELLHLVFSYAWDESMIKTLEKDIEFREFALCCKNSMITQLQFAKTELLHEIKMITNFVEYANDIPASQLNQIDCCLVIVFLVSSQVLLFSIDILSPKQENHEALGWVGIVAASSFALTSLLMGVKRSCDRKNSPNFVAMENMNSYPHLKFSFANLYKLFLKSPRQNPFEKDKVNQTGHIKWTQGSSSITMRDCLSVLHEHLYTLHEENTLLNAKLKEEEKYFLNPSFQSIHQNFFFKGDRKESKREADDIPEVDEYVDLERGLSIPI